VVKVTFILSDGARREVSVEANETLMQAATANLVPGIIGECGGNLTCATCHVFVDKQWIEAIPPKTCEEEEMLEGTAEEPTEYSRLSCQIRVTPELDGIVVRIPSSQR
jgi:2Fe-2S ferredoxin